jgi:hypothetical protein
MDNRLEPLYYPYGREEEVIDIDNDDHIITADDIEYINDGTVDDDLDIWILIVHFIIEILNFTTSIYYPEYFEKVQNPNRWWVPTRLGQPLL